MDLNVPELEILLLQPEPGDEIAYLPELQELVMECPAGDGPLLKLDIGGTLYVVRADWLKIRISKPVFDRMAAVVRDSG